jgi:hypothetical protein
MKRALILCLLLVLLMTGSASAQFALGWTDENDPPADYYILYRSAHPDTGYLMLDFVTPLGETQEYMYYDSTAVEGTPYYYRVAAVRDLDHSDLSSWSRGLWYDKSGGTFAFYTFEHWPGMDQRNMLIVYTPLEECELLWSFRYTDPDLIAVKCAPFTGTVPPISITPRSP